MCGIAGTFTCGTAPAEADQHRAMATYLEHRGPDATRLQPLPGGALVSTRLAIIDPAGADQPLHGCGAVVCVYNGEIYNFEQLRAQLLARGHRLTGEGDGEVIPHLYEEHGRQFVHHLRGAFAIALHDPRHDELLLIRDRMGEKPLVYRSTADTVCFASEVRALQAVTDLGPVSPAALRAYLQFGFVPEPDTLLADVKKLPAGHFAVARRTPAWSFTVHKYWAPPAEPPAASRAQLLTGAAQALSEAVAQQTRADVPVGLALSGGIDSTLLTRLGVRTLSDPRTYSVGFDWVPPDELAAAAATAQAVHSKHSEIRLSVHDYTTLLFEGARGAAEPIADWTMPAYLALTTRCREDGVRVLLTGHGPDEICTAYAWTRQALAQVPAAPGAPKHDAYLFNPEYREAAELIGHLVVQPAAPPQLGLCAAGSPAEFRRALRSALLHGYLQSNGLMQLDSLGLLKAVEVRIPYVDHQFLQAAIPYDDLEWEAGSVPKGPLYAMAAILGLPCAFVEKRPFFPIIDPLIAPVTGLAREIVPSGELVGDGLISPVATQRLLDSATHNGNGLNVLFRLFVIDLWLADLRRPSR
jgi:asparagine synthase (glutamine-hydrolysing)